MWKAIILSAFVVSLAIVISKPQKPKEVKNLVPQAPIESSFNYFFDSKGVLQESEDEAHSTSPYWWLDSGGELLIKNGYGYTISGELAEGEYWRQLYSTSNPADTEEGKHPQNLFRLITRSKWQNFSQEVYFIIDDYHLSQSPNRNESNGLLLMSRYIDENNLYYAGIRVDGYAVIKKKSNGLYSTLIQKQIFPGTYSRKNSPNLLPMRQKIGLKTTIQTQSDGSAELQLFMKKEKGEWQQVLEYIDSENPINTPAHAGIRTDFMDVRFDDYKIEKLNS